LQKYML